MSVFLARDYAHRTPEDHFAQLRFDLPAAPANVDLKLATQAFQQMSLVVDYLLP